jgi:ribonuclease-3
MMSLRLQQLCQRIGYQFKDAELLQLALTHRSFGKQNNERLEFLGDSLLNFFIADALYQQFPSTKEGNLSRLRASLVKGVTLAKIALELQLGDDLRLGSGELKSGGNRRESILADTVEAIIGAIYLDAGESAARERVMCWFESRLENLDLEQDTKDAKTRLQEFLQGRGHALPHYEVVATRGGDHDPEFDIACHVDGLSSAVLATANSRKKAEQLAARQALKQLGAEKR